MFLQSKNSNNKFAFSLQELMRCYNNKKYCCEFTINIQFRVLQRLLRVYIKHFFFLTNVLISTIIDKKNNDKNRKSNSKLLPLSFSVCHKQAQNLLKSYELTRLLGKSVTKNQPICRSRLQISKTRHS